MNESEQKQEIVMIEMTERQESYLDTLAHGARYASVEHAVAAVVGRSLSDVRKRGISIGEASETIDALREQLGR